MDFGLHLPLMDLGGDPFRLEHLIAYAEAAQKLGYRALSANDHLVAVKPWLDGPTALAAVLSHSGDLQLVTSVSLPVVRGPAPLAKALGAIDRLSGGRLIACVGPGSAARDYAPVGIPFEERWARFDEAVQALRALWNPDAPAFKGKFYSTEGIRLEPLPVRRGGPPLWVGSWGSDAGLRRVVHLADGWLASGPNTTPEEFAKRWHRLQELLAAAGRDPGSFPNALSSVWFYISEDKSVAERMLSEVLAPALFRPTAELRERMLVGSARDCAAKLAAYHKAGVQRVYIWPIADELEQIELFMHKVVPLIK